MNKELHVVSISGGKDSAALAIYLKNKYPNIKFEYLFFDTGEELQDTYDYLRDLENLAGIEVQRLKPKKSFKELLMEHNDFLPSPMERWCTRKMKLETFLNKMKEYSEYQIYNYIGIRADENRDGLVPTQENITTVMPFKDDGITLDDVKRILNDIGLGLPKYYDAIYDEKYDIEYFRSRSGCYFCFFMRQIEWVWLYEQRPKEFKKAMEFEKDGYSWIKGMPLSELIKPENIDKIKKSYKRMEEIRKNQPIKNGTMMQEMEFISKHDKMIYDIEKDKLCTMCTL
ncbi:phosphoadenosine phosphosulfate reductase family protein [Campylobacter sp. RM12327]|uniref:phosphoadenosine phosphosulfate reductase domain-containing protein n=1 Tax=Campylobacter sputorum TaxID=206 RepID=UPI000B797019|nr:MULTISPECIES: phosphoadenosine phosphosulfate reductase family protein [Campylobacter]ASM40157.1 phosphoadenosine phosphosulfate reductase family protein [Campylobacter sputorum]MBE7358545.1 phosphoadenosine phosphosulfate reductase family protein [Campylobacter sp. RM11302]MBF6669887.1 phosphoadenosine phosphosulfate reductase family protein [Campylobacter sp. RM12327]MBF6675143.1 phosphoadenosine phosphosulfate reductase family protein [Campylobacter sp. RM13538]MBF6676435.1 phosphoadenos